LGKWCSSDHRTFTANAFWETLPEKYKTRQNTRIAWVIIHKIMKENVNVDSEFFKNLEYHFNRPVDRDEADNVRQQNYVTWRDKYIANNDRMRDEFDAYLTDEVPSYGDCKDALVRLGRLTHAWQDFYAHAIDKDSDGEVSMLDGVWYKDVGTLSGATPDNPGIKLKPSSFGYLGWDFWNNDFGEHGIGEPGNRARDKATRRQSSEDFTATKFDTYLVEKWLPKCWCPYKMKHKKAGWFSW
jgi:hypothetical protein